MKDQKINLIEDLLMKFINEKILRDIFSKECDTRS